LSSSRHWVAALLENNSDIQPQEWFRVKEADTLPQTNKSVVF